MSGPDLSPVTGNEVLQKERAAIAAAAGEPLVALCLSGGGIRSATFCLGVLQALARYGWVDQFHYLSSVSGGGYISGWLMAWRKNRAAFGRLSELLLNPTAEPVQHLRQYSNYLTPRLGGLGADTWTLGVILLRNLLLHWCILLPLLLGLLLVPRTVLAMVQELRLSLAWYLAGSAFAVYSIHWLARCLPSLVERRPTVIRTDGQMMLLHVLPGFLGCLCFTAGWVITRSQPGALGVPHTVFLLFAALLHVAGWVAGCVASGHSLQAKDWVLLTLMGGLAGYVIAVTTHVARYLFGNDLLLWVAFGPALLLSSIILATFVMIGIGSFREELTEDDREWYSRGAALSLLVAFGWSAWAAFVLFVPSWPVLDRLHGLNWQTLQPNLVGMLLTLATLWLARRAVGRGRWNLYLGKALLVGALLLFFALLAHFTSSLPGLASTNHRESLQQAPLRLTAAWLVGCLAASFLCSACFSVNRFSMNAFYRNRLIRAFLGASFPTPPSSFTGLANEQNLSLAELLQDQPSVTNRPLPILNMALNISKGKNLAWQQRRATSFIASPLYCGWYDTASTRSYISPKRYSGDGGLRLGTAMAISGAAVSPNMGYHSSQLLTFLMTLFNLRLGAWLPNPASADVATLQMVSPASPLRVLAEAMGSTTESYKWIYLSDGGHFENLGVYEMLRRKATFLLVVDAAADPAYEYGDLHRLIALARTDFGHEIVPAGPGRYCVHYQGGETGYLLLIKPTRQPNLAQHSPDVARYAERHPEFPQQTTADQFFDEDQFEAYRRLGSMSLPATRAASLTEFFLEQFPEAAAASVIAKAAAAKR